MNAPHTPVLLNEVLALFSDIKNGVFVDCTVGYGGHAEAILNALPTIKYIAIDRDQTAIDFSKERLKQFADRTKFVYGAFGEILQTLGDINICGCLADLGVSSLQLDRRERGFSFESETLDMRMDNSQIFTAQNVVNEYDHERLTAIFRDYGEEADAHAKAELIIKNRPFASAKELSNLIQNRFSRGKIHAATKIFQAIRIEVNDELKQLNNLLDAFQTQLFANAVIGIIAFHSLEDRVVKERFKLWSRNCICPPNAYKCTCGNSHSRGTIVTKKPIIASNEEIMRNPRSRSAKLRGFCFKDK